MRGPSRELRRRGLLLCLTLLLAIGLGAASSAHDASHAGEHGDEHGNEHGAGGGHACVACHLSALEAPELPRPLVRPLAPVAARQAPTHEPRAAARLTHRIPRAPPAR